MQGKEKIDRKSFDVIPPSVFSHKVQGQCVVIDVFGNVVVFSTTLFTQIKFDYILSTWSK